MHLIPVLITALYVLITAWAIWLPFSPSANDPLWGIYAVLLTQPWSTLGISIIDAINPTLMDQGGGIAVLILGGLLNAFILYHIASWVTRRFTKTS